MRPARLRARSAALILASLHAACARTPDKRDLVPIGGGWYFDLRSHLPEAGWVPTDLYRDWEGKPVVVARNIEDHKFYEPDCVVFVTGHASPPYVTYAACGDRLPVAIDVRDYPHWKLDPDGLRHENSARLVDGVPVKRTEAFSLDEIRTVAERQPPFDPGWKPGGRGTVGVLRAIAQDVPVGGATQAAGEGLAERGGRPPLVEAAASPAGTGPHRLDRLAMVDALIKRGEPVDATDPYGFTPLMMAAAAGDVQLVQRLLEAGASVNARAGDGRTALMIGAETLGERTETVRALINAGADRTIRDNDGQTAADKIRASQDTELLSLLE